MSLSSCWPSVFNASCYYSDTPHYSLPPVYHPSSLSSHIIAVIARLVSETRKFDSGLRQLTHVDLHWLDVPERVKFKLVSMVHNCFHHKDPRYLTDYCIPISDVASRRHLRSARRQLPRCASTQSQLVWASGIVGLTDPTLTLTVSDSA